jgi:hypothetical protein
MASWLLAAGVVSIVGTGFLRQAQGMKFNKLKSGALRTRALSMASRMGVTLDRGLRCPRRKRAFDQRLRDVKCNRSHRQFRKYLTKAQLELVMAHELAHVKLNRVRKYSLLALAVFSITALLLFSFSSVNSASSALASIRRRDWAARGMALYYNIARDAPGILRTEKLLHTADSRNSSRHTLLSHIGFMPLPMTAVSPLTA